MKKSFKKFCHFSHLEPFRYKSIAFSPLSSPNHRNIWLFCNRWVILQNFRFLNYKISYTPVLHLLKIFTPRHSNANLSLEFRKFMYIWNCEYFLRKSWLLVTINVDIYVSLPRWAVIFSWGLYNNHLILDVNN